MPPHEENPVRKRDRTIAAKRRILRELIEHLRRAPASGDDSAAAVQDLVAEFSRRARLRLIEPPAGQEVLPGMECDRVS